MTEEPITSKRSWHRIAIHAVRHNLRTATREHHGSETVELRARNSEFDDLLVVEESSNDHLFGWHTIAKYDREAVVDFLDSIGNEAKLGVALIRHEEEIDEVIEETWDRGAKTRERTKPDIEFADLEYAAWLRQCRSCGYSNVVTEYGADWEDCCADPDRHGSPLINRNESVDIVSAVFEERIVGMDDGPARDELVDVYQTLFPEWEEREVTEA